MALYLLFLLLSPSPSVMNKLKNFGNLPLARTANISASIVSHLTRGFITTAATVIYHASCTYIEYFKTHCLYNLYIRGG